jgi:hypothetical protein
VHWAMERLRWRAVRSHSGAAEARNEARPCAAMAVVSVTSGLVVETVRGEGYTIRARPHPPEHVRPGLAGAVEG